MKQLIVVLALVFSITGSAAFAGGFPGGGLGQPGQEEPVPPPEFVPPPPAPPQVSSMCEGVFQGGYWNMAGTLIIQIEAVGGEGDLLAQAWWRGGYWRGQGHCWQSSPYGANIELYFPSTPVHRAAIEGRGPSVVMQGQVDGGNAFRLFRQ